MIATRLSSNGWVTTQRLDRNLRFFCNTVRGTLSRPAENLFELERYCCKDVRVHLCVPLSVLARDSGWSFFPPLEQCQ